MLYGHKKSNRKVVALTLASLAFYWSVFTTFMRMLCRILREYLYMKICFMSIFCVFKWVYVWKMVIFCEHSVWEYVWKDGFKSIEHIICKWCTLLWEHILFELTFPTKVQISHLVTGSRSSAGCIWTENESFLAIRIYPRIDIIPFETLTSF